MEYDYVIVGGGPTGLTLATYLPGKIALVERHPVLGGCHRVDSKTYTRFVEHGPRVYSGAYVNVARVLQKIGLSWDQVFEKIQFSPEDIDGKRWYQWLSVKEITHLTLDYLVFAIYNKDHGKDISMKTYCASRHFSPQSLEYIDMVCRFSDGAGASRYSLWEFVSGFDQHISPFYAPRKPNDSLFDTWHRYLTNKGVDLILGANVTSVSKNTVVVSGKKTMTTAKVVLCIPPVYADKLLKKSKVQDTKFRDFAVKTKYDMYWSVSFFGATYGKQKNTPWGIIAVQYPFGVVSAAATKYDVPSPVTGKTLKRTSNAKEVSEEIRRQLGFSDSVEYAYATGKYNDQAFVAAAKKGHYKSELSSGIAVVGCHNGNSTYNFTSMESAVQNALVYAGRTPETVWFASDYLRFGLVGAVFAMAVLNR